MSLKTDNDKKYVASILNSIKVCENYTPKFGHGKAMTLKEFQEMYHSDQFYSWFGLDSPLIYSAHKAAGGITSVYRQIGIGCERLFQLILMEELGLTKADAMWNYEIKNTSGKKAKLSLDGRIEIKQIKKEKQAIFKEWMNEAYDKLDISIDMKNSIIGSVFEVRQGYKSRDSKRQNADISNSAVAYTKSYLPVLLVLSNQIDDTIVDRYEKAKWLILKGNIHGSNVESTYSFMKNIIGYDLASFFERNSDTFKEEIEKVIKGLLS